jgi:hypothetical protein
MNLKTTLLLFLGLSLNTFAQENLTYQNHLNQS